MPESRSRLVMLLLMGGLLLIFALENRSLSMDTPLPSTSLAEFNQFIDTDIPASAVTWETFGTPEYTGGVPAPTDYVTLVAEITLAKDWPVNAEKIDLAAIAIVPEAARPWLSLNFRAMLMKYKNQSVELPAKYACASYQARLRKSGRLVPGFICPDSGKLLLYLVLREPS